MPSSTPFSATRAFSAAAFLALTLLAPAGSTFAFDCNSNCALVTDPGQAAACAAIKSSCVSNTAVRDTQEAAISLPQPFGGRASLAIAVGQVLRRVLGLVGIVAFLMFLYGGWLYLSAGGDAGKTKKGKETVVWAAIGLIAIFASYAGVLFAFQLAGVAQ